MRINSSQIFSIIDKVTSQAKVQPKDVGIFLANMKGLKNTGVIFNKKQSLSGRQAISRNGMSPHPIKLKRQAPLPTAEMKAAVQLKKISQNTSLEKLAAKLKVGLEEFEIKHGRVDDKPERGALTEKEQQRIKVEIEGAQKKFNIYAQQKREEILDGLSKEMLEPVNLKLLKPCNAKQRPKLEDVFEIKENNSEVLEVEPFEGNKPITHLAEQLKLALQNRMFIKRELVHS